jgi:SAM-dependent methyltransferase
MRLFRTETRDFSDAELLATKESLGQLYLDVSTKIAPDDFARDLRPLRPSAECAACDRRPSCTGAWEPMNVDVFTRDDAAVTSILAGLRGRVLDVGCGEGPYLRVLADSAKDGQLDYIGVDPDAGRLSVLASRYPFARFLEASAEEIGDDLGPVDHALVLRSYNHLRDPARAIGRLLSLIRPGGTLLLVDNVAFGLVRSRDHARRAETAAENRFEHYRNDGALEAARLFEGLPVRLIERRDVGRGTSNQWLLRYERTELATG